MLIGRKEKKIEELIGKFFLKVKESLPELARLIDDYMNKDKQFKEDAYQVHLIEHEADDMRRNILSKIYEGAFLPFYRGDYIILILMGDEIANLAESVASYLVLTRPEIPDFMEVGVKEMTSSTIDTFEPLEEMLKCSFTNCQLLPALVKDIEEREQKVDRLQWELIKALFKSDLPLARKLHLKQFVDQLAGISDQVEDVGEKLEIMISKRPV